MKHISFTKKVCYLSLCVWAGLASSCIKEDLDACYNLTLKVENADGGDITTYGLVEDASVYVFDENLNYLETRHLDKDFILSKSEIQFSQYPDNKKLKLVAWGNMAGQNQTVSEAQKIEDLKLMLKKQDGMAQSPDSLYYGSKEVVTQGSGIAGGNGELPIRLKTSTVTMKTIGLPTAVQTYGLKSASAFDFYMNRTLDTYDYAGSLTGDSIAYHPEGVYDANQEWMSKGIVDKPDRGGKQNTFAGQNLSFSIYKNGELLQTVTEAFNVDTGKNEPFRVDEGGRLDVLFEFKEGTISARMIITPWGVVDQDIEF